MLCSTLSRLRLLPNGIHVQKRGLHTTPNPSGFFSSAQHDEPLIKRIARRLGWSETSKSYLGACGYLMYIKVADQVNYLNFFKHCRLEDTFVSWFTVVELHLWMLGARVMQEGDEGRLVRNSMFKALWEDCDTKSKKLEGAIASARKRQIQEIGDQFQATLVSYDEGLQGSDVVLAGALWRRFLRGRENGMNVERSPEDLLQDAMALEMLVLYVRSQYYNLNDLGKLQVYRRNFQWSQFDESLYKMQDKIPQRTSRRSM